MILSFYNIFLLYLVFFCDIFQILGSLYFRMIHFALPAAGKNCNKYSLVDQVYIFVRRKKYYLNLCHVVDHQKHYIEMSNSWVVYIQSKCHTKGKFFVYY